MISRADMDDFAIRFATLTAKEAETVRLRCKGVSRAEQMRIQYCGLQTIKNRLTTAYRKLNPTAAPSNAEYIPTLCYRLGLHDYRAALRAVQEAKRAAQ